jgi:hypothetical protein
MGKRSRRRGDDEPRTPEIEYRDAEGNLLLLRAALSPASRREYAATLQGTPLSREDAWQRAAEFLFERLAVRWDIAGTDPIVKQRDLVARYRFASHDERGWIREVLRLHLAEYFPEMEAP